jgi:hypothetical protein
MKILVRFALGGVVTALATFFSWGLVASWLLKGIGSSEVASWVQALGSIGALGVAIYVMSEQNKTATLLASETDQRALLRRAASVSAMVERGHFQIQAVLLNILHVSNGGNLCDISQSFQNGQKVLSELRSTLASIPLHDLGSYDMASGVHKMLETLTNFDDAAMSWHACPYVSSLPSTIALMRELVEIADNSIKTFQNGVLELRNIPRISL